MIKDRFYTGLVDRKGQKIYTGDFYTPVYVAPNNSIYGLDKEREGVIKFEAGCCWVMPEREEPYLLCSQINQEFKEYRSNIGEIWWFADNVCLGEIEEKP